MENTAELELDEDTVVVEPEEAPFYPLHEFTADSPTTPTKDQTDEDQQELKEDALHTKFGSTVSNESSSPVGSNVERKQYSEREITYNLLLRRLVDEFLDRTITFSHQPKITINALRNVLHRNFPEFGEVFHRERVCAYLKACRRNARKKNGEPCVRISARYLSAGIATRMAEQIYARERDSLIKICTPQLFGLRKTERRRPYISTMKRILPNNRISADISSYNTRHGQSLRNLNVDRNIKPTICSQREPTQTISMPSSTGTAEHTIAKLLGQTAEFLLTVADRLDKGLPVLMSQCIPMPGMGTTSNAV